MKKRVRGIVVSHTHWDRAWYQPFQSFRLRMVRTVDALLDLLETQKEFEAFTLDGQSVLLEDYLEIRPENRPRLEALIRAGRLLIGPWYTLPDMFLPAGESIIRNLQIGRAVCRKFGKPMNVGYVPDPFGHFAQMPQVLQGFGIDNFIFMRGLPKEVRDGMGSIFNWKALDGSTVLAINEPSGYLGASGLGHPVEWGRFDGHPAETALAKKRVEENIAVQMARQEESVVLLANGCDHMPAQPEIPAVIRELKAGNPEWELVHGSFADFVKALRDEGAEHGTYTGDLTGNVDHPLLLSVYSTRTYLKELNHEAQRKLMRYAEPMTGALAMMGVASPEAHAFLEKAWKTLLSNHAHDDICGCSIDSVHRENETRFGEASQIAETLVTESLESLMKKGFKKPAITGDLSSDLWVFNPQPFETEVDVVAQVLFANPEGEWGAPTPEKKLKALDAQGGQIPVTVTGTVDRMVRAGFLETTWGRSYDVALKVRVPALGYHLVHVYESEEAGDCLASRPKVAPATRLESADYVLECQGDSLSLTHRASGHAVRDFLRFEFQRDWGDTYSFNPHPDDPIRHSRLVSARTHESLPGVWVLEHEVPGWEGTASLRVRTELKCGAGSIDLDIRYENTVPNARLRAVFAAGFEATAAISDGHFRQIRHAKPEKIEYTPQKQVYPGERPYPTRHQGDFSILESASGMKAWVANRGLPEFEWIEGAQGSALAITLHRSVGYLSVANGSIRACQAGPQIPTPEAQCLRPMRHALSVGFSNAELAEITKKAQEFSVPAWIQEMPYLPYLKTAGEVPRSGSWLEIHNPHVMMSAFKAGEKPKTLVLRLYNASDSRQTTGLAFKMLESAKARWCTASLEENWDETQAQALEKGRMELTLEPHRITTILIARE